MVENKVNKIAIFSIMTVMFLAAIENMITTTIMPSVISSIGGLTLYPWLSVVFILLSTVTLPLYGKLSDMYGYKLFTIIAILIFTIGSGLCGLSNSMIELIIYRGIQGIGAGGLITMSYILFAIIFTDDKRAKMQSVLSAMWSIASLTGPVLGSIFDNTIGWRWAFYFNVPIGIIIIFLISKFLYIKQNHTSNKIIDYRGIILFSITMTLIIYPLLSFGDKNFNNQKMIILFFGIVFLLFLIKHEKKFDEPILPIREFINPSFGIPFMINFTAASCLFSTINFLPLFIQGYIGDTSNQVGKILMFLSLSWTTGSILSGNKINKWGARNFVIYGSISMIIGFFILTTLKDFSYTKLIISCIFLGFGMGSISNTTLFIAQSNADKNNIGKVTAGIQLFRNIGGTLGNSILGGIQITNFKYYILPYKESLKELYENPHKILGYNLRLSLPEQSLNILSNALADSIIKSITYACIISIITLFLSLRLFQNKRSNIIT
ncbi:MAG: MFS transporter [Candidatus Sericytochromatia bacterium]|nr:MAG: MFS transporter [Candidatus Sericytochromatia bacterium]